jgi:hypothetical protein
LAILHLSFLVQSLKSLHLTPNVGFPKQTAIRPKLESSMVWHVPGPLLHPWKNTSLPQGVPFGWGSGMHLRWAWSQLQQTKSINCVAHNKKRNMEEEKHVEQKQAIEKLQAEMCSHV